MSVFDGVALPKTIYEVDSKYNGKISVIQVGKTRKLSVDNTVQSINWDSPSAGKTCWGDMVELLKLEVTDMASVMVLGLGGGTVAHLISKAFPQAIIVSVEIDPAMVDIANRFFGVDKIPNHRVIVDDACRVVVDPDEFELKESTFDALIVDIFCGQTYPDLGDSGNFVSRAVKLVKSGGLVIFNRIYLEEHQDEVNSFIEFIGNYIPNIQTRVVAGKTNSDNILIYGKVS
ncbi:MAG: hypothetical protein UX44_C0023G0007 [candidate division WWE3 bacterium GW2011_GWA1_46_21]|uniref:Methyltransferase type 11 domain-containing protein n=3 Tax=Katanobacteria TaxID=422282 RepID=A0A0G1SAU2_UNCKA|nr:MAG: hypothetical protein UX44_C0023G0007 [candidate division WWE3 bacterium GW2011_GWA1_46_21]KKU51319.1 MAG: hypothetical protein UX73_C0003G0007 [candidate division WWE3 bacterium GW2011_GWC1_47_10]KKU57274.1 MAG: hypothetical protein UX79_C0016G0007 [candidate division WWE3 bacterium GW2011_GWB1_47_11]